MIGLSSGSEGAPETISPAAIAHGQGDAELVALNQGLAQYGKPVWVRPLAELNGHWNAYCAYNQDGSSPGPSDSTAEFKKAFARIFLIVKGIGGARDLDTSGDGGKVIIGTTVGTALWGALGLGVGSILRNQVGAIVGSLVYLFVLENLLQIIPGLDDIIAKYGFGGLSNGLFGADPDSTSDVLGQVPAGLLLAAYAAILVVIGILVVQRRDVTA